MISGRVIIQFDDLLLVLNDAQLKSVLTTYKEITELMARASEQRKQHAGENLVVRISFEEFNVSTYIFFIDLRNLTNNRNHQNFSLNHNEQDLLIS